MRFRPAENPLRTRADLTALLHTLSEPLPAFATAGRTGLHLGANKAIYGDSAAMVESYARPLWGWVPAAMGGDIAQPWAQWREGLDHGTDPEHAEFWGWPKDRDQKLVEMPAIALGLALAGGVFTDGISSEVRRRAVAWLGRINSVEVVDSNWHFFRVLVNVALRCLGEPWSAQQLDADLRRIDEFYLGDGWYADGEGRRGDYYVPMAMHFYGLIYAKLAGEADPERAEEWRRRAKRFAIDYQHWFAADGSALPFGRSLTYRFAQGAFWGALAFADVEALPWGVIKGFHLRHLRWWMQQPIFSDGGLLTIGYQYPNLIMAEGYNAPGSPYWAFKAFLPLALPEGHPFWQATEIDMPGRPLTATVPNAGLVLTRDAADDHVVAINAGQPISSRPRHAAQKYSKFAYSTAFAFSVSAGGDRLSEGGFDSTLALSDDDDHFRTREKCLAASVEGNVAYSSWNPWPDVEIGTWLYAFPSGHLRVHRLDTGRDLRSAETGFAVPHPARSETIANRIICHGEGGASGLFNLLGARKGNVVAMEPNTNLANSLTSMPVLSGRHPQGRHWLACYVAGWRGNGASFIQGMPALVCQENANGLSVLLNGQILFDTSSTPNLRRVATGRLSNIRETARRLVRRPLRAVRSRLFNLK